MMFKKKILFSLCNNLKLNRVSTKNLMHEFIPNIEIIGKKFQFNENLIFKKLKGFKNQIFKNLLIKIKIEEVAFKN